MQSLLYGFTTQDILYIIHKETGEIPPHSAWLSWDYLTYIANLRSQLTITEKEKTNG